MVAIDASPVAIFPGEISEYLPEPIEQESVYGWCARYHRLSGSSDPRHTCRILFGRHAASLNHDFPVGLNHFRQVTRNLLGPPEEVLRARTMYGFHAPFIPAEWAAKIALVMHSGNGITPRKMLGLNKFAAVPVPLKACLDCLAKQQRVLSVTTWITMHQWPTSTVCATHNTLLRTLRHEYHLPGVRDFLLPSEIVESDWLPNPKINPESLAYLISIGQWTQTLAGQAHLHLDATLLRYVYLLQAKQKGWLAWDGTLRLHKLRDAFEKAVSPCRDVLGLGFLADIQGVNAGFLGMLLRQYPGHRHPAKHVFLQQFLFTEPAEFLTAYREAQAIDAAEGQSALNDKLRDTQRTLEQLVESKHLSVNAAAAELDIPPAQAIRHLQKQGITYQNRPRIQGQVKSRLDALLKTGVARNVIAETLKIRKGYIKDYLAQKPELRHDWEKARGEQLTSAYREHFFKVLKDNPGVPIKRIRRIPKSGFEWLYRNDRDWLASNLPGIWQRPD